MTKKELEARIKRLEYGVRVGLIAIKALEDINDTLRAAEDDARDIITVARGEK